MSRVQMPFVAEDISVVAKSLRKQLDSHTQPPSHVELLNMLARANGHRNYQHLRAQVASETRLSSASPAVESIDHQSVERVSRHFDDKGRLIRWPAKASHQALCLWLLWAAFPPRQIFTELQINAFLKERHLFSDHAILRRALCDANLIARTPDCREYRRIERRPTADARALIRHLKAATA